MIYFIEGCTCAGKSTLAKKISEEKQIPLAPEHTPAPLTETPSIVKRQQILFADFVSQFTSMIATKKDYIADFSPWGVIPFSRAYASFLKRCCPNNCTDADSLIKLASVQNKFMTDFQEAFKEHLSCVCYLEAQPNMIRERLIARGREGDNCWKEDFIDLLVKEYNEYFQHFWKD